MKSKKVIDANDFLEEYEINYGKIRKVTGTIGKWFDPNRKLFFNCDDVDKSKCVDQIYLSPDIDNLIVYFIVKSKDGYQLRDTRFKNIYDQNLEGMIHHYHDTLEPSVKHGLQVGHLSYIECIGYSAIIKDQKRKTVSDISLIKNIVEKETGFKYQIFENLDKPKEKIFLPLKKPEKNISIARIQISENTLILYAKKDKILKKPDKDFGNEWKKYLKNVQWKNAMSLTIREKYYGTLLTFDPITTSFKVELNYPVEEEKLRKACSAIDESRLIE